MRFEDEDPPIQWGLIVLYALILFVVYMVLEPELAHAGKGIPQVAERSLFTGLIGGMTDVEVVLVFVAILATLGVVTLAGFVMWRAVRRRL